MSYESGIADVDDAEFALLVDDTRSAAARLAAVVLGTAQGADDVVQIALERAWRARESYDPARPFRPWLLRIVANTARNDRRARGRRAQLALRAAGEASESPPSIEDVAVTADERRVVLAGLNRLASADREVIALRFFDELSESEMATVLDCPAGTVKSQLSRAMARLRVELERGDVDGEPHDAARLEAVLRSIGAHLSTSEPGDEEAIVTPLPRRRLPVRSRRWIAAAAAALVAVVAVGALTPVGDTVAGWFGIGGLTVTVVLPQETLPAPDEVFTDAVRPLDAAAAWNRAGIAPETFDDSTLGRPDMYGEPPEGGVVFGWDDNEASLWVRSALDDAERVVKKQVVDSSSAEWVPGLGDNALLVDGAHILETPFRRVGADRVLWWLDGTREYRLESTLSREAMIDVAELVVD